MAVETPIYLTRAQSRAVDEIATRDFGMMGIVLMENAGRNCAEFIFQWIEQHPNAQDLPIVICCGKGNNGGDGFVIARHLTNRGIEPTILLWASSNELSGDAETNFAILQKMHAHIVKFGDPKWRDCLAAIPREKAIIVDALLGTGAQGEPRPPYDEAIRWINSLGAVVFAIDLPSGLDADSGKSSASTIRANHTLTFVSQKTGFARSDSQAYLGDIHVFDIGVPRSAIAVAAKR